jgi:hypothetical protein
MSSKLLVASALALSLATAKADSIAASLYTPQAPAGSVITTIDLTGITPASQSTIIGAGYTIEFIGVAANQGVVQGASSGQYAIPVAGVSGSDPLYLTGGYNSPLTDNANNSGNYFSTGLGTIKITFATPQEGFALLWGSIDMGNSLTFNNATNLTVTGADVQAAAAGFVSNGFQGPGGSAWVTIAPTGTFTEVLATSNVVSFEFAGAVGGEEPFSPVPEPSSVLMSISGIGVLGAALVRRSRRSA